MMIPRIDLPRTGRNIAYLRKRSNISVRELQCILGFSTPQAIYKWQHGECLPTVDNLLILSRVFHVGLEDLLIVDEEEALPLAS